MDAPTGLIPARAGTTASCTRELPRRGAHPRSRGDHLRVRSVPAWGGAHPRSRGDHRMNSGSAPVIAGSSPLARGPLCRQSSARCRRGLIPARAGTTERLEKIDFARRAHPRSRGDHYHPGNRAGVDGGSSPLARGPRGYVFAVLSIGGLIPARAGTTYRRTAGNH